MKDDTYLPITMCYRGGALAWSCHGRPTMIGMHCIVIPVANLHNMDM